MAAPRRKRTQPQPPDQPSVRVSVTKYDVTMGWLAANSHVATKALESLPPIPRGLRTLDQATGSNRKRRATATKVAPNPESEELRVRGARIASRDARLRALVRDIVNKFGADEARLQKILYTYGDLEVILGDLYALEYELAHRIIEAEAASEVARVLRRRDWPFDGENDGDTPHPLSQTCIQTLLRSRQADAEQARKELAQIAKRKRLAGLSKPAGSTSFQKLPAILRIAVQLVDYLIFCEFDRQGKVNGRWQAREAVGLQDAREDIGKRCVGAIYAASAALLNETFPTLARVNKASIAAAVAQRFR